MTPRLDKTHDPGRTSWVESANAPDTDFPIHNLPLGIFRVRGTATTGHVGVAIGDMILDVTACGEEGLLPGVAAEVAACSRGGALNPLMALGRGRLREFRAAVSGLLASGATAKERVRGLLVRMRDAELCLPAAIGDYTDFYASLHHATNVGSMFRPDNPLLPNYKFVPIGYHGRSSSISVSGTPVRRPAGQTRDEGANAPSFGASTQLDFECEVGCFVGPGNSLGSTIPITEAEEHLFGLCLLNDWSARDIQKWEYQPLGPFLAKNFASTLSPWVVTMDALEPFRVPAVKRPPPDPPPLPYLSSPADLARGGIDVTLEVLLVTSSMRKAGTPPFRVSRGRFREMYWSFAQMLTHHASNGCNLRPADLLGSGTVSGPEKGSFGSLLETTRRGVEPLVLPGGERRVFLEDGDEVIIHGYCEGEGARRIGFGECRGTILPR